jgi:hypothetical protein
MHVELHRFLPVSGRWTSARGDLVVLHYGAGAFILQPFVDLPHALVTGAELAAPWLQ